MRCTPGPLCRLVALCLSALPGAASLAAQDVPSDPRRGLWIGFGLGAGSGQIDCSRCGQLEPNDPWKGGAGAAGYFAIGSTVGANLLIGGEVNVWARVKRSEGQQRDATLYLLSLHVRYHAARASGFYAKGGVGTGGSILAGGPGLIESGGWGAQLGGGYEVFLGNRLALSPFLSYVHLLSKGAAGRNRGTAAIGPDDPGYLQFGLGLTWY